MFTAHQLSKRFDGDLLFEDVTFSINSGDRVGLVGPNGSGKTTLLRILTGELHADTGHVTRPADSRFGYLPQGFTLDPTRSLEDALYPPETGGADPAAALADLAVRLGERPDDTALQARYEQVLLHLSRFDPGRAAAVMAGLGLDHLDGGLPVGRLSGGQKTRLLLARLLMQNPTLLLLDEPTNHLDIRMLEWLEGWLSDFEGGALIVSHDRTFLDRTCTRILALDPLQRRVREYPGNYSDYVAQVEAEREKQAQAYADQQLEMRKMRQDIARVKAQAARTEREASSIRIGGPEMKLKGFKDYQQGIAKKVARKAKARERKLERYETSADRVDKPRRNRQVNIDFGETRHLGRFVLQIEGAAVGYAGHPPLLRDVNLTVTSGERIVITGANGAGKTTLMRTLRGRLPLLAGELRVGPTVQFGYMAQEQGDLDLAATPLETVQPFFANETAARSFLAQFLLTDELPLRPNRRLSFGERARLTLARLIARGCNCLLLDEPVNHLDIPSRTEFESALTAFDGTVLAVVHDRYLIERLATTIWWVEDGRIELAAGPPSVA